MHVTLGRGDPTDPPAAGMRQLTYIACGYASASAGVAGLGAKPLALVVVGATGLAHAALASWHGLKRGEQDLRRREADAITAATTLVTREGPEASAGG